MAHSSRSKEPVQPVIDYSYDSNLLERHQSTEAVNEFLDDLLTCCAKILHEKEMMSRRFSFAAHALSNELLMNVSWAYPPLDENDFIFDDSNIAHSNNYDPDEDLEMPPIDEWAGGVLPVRDAEATGLRTAVDPTPKTPSGLPKSGLHTPRRRPTANKTAAPNSIDQNKKQEQQPADQQDGQANSATATATSTASFSRTKKNGVTIAKKKVKPPPTPADTILRTFEDIRKKSNISTKSVTVDSDFSVIQITEPHGLPPSLIVPRIQTKKMSNKDDNDGKTETVSGRSGPRTARLRNTVNKTNGSKTARSIVGNAGITSSYGRATATIKKPEAKKRLPPKIIETDQPKFDTELSEVTFADRIALSPGVTFREGNIVKTRPPTTDESQMTRSQYEQYLEEMMRDTEQS